MLRARDLSAVARARLSILAVAVVFLAAKVWVAATTFGSNDISHWLDFLHGVRQDGPIGVYGAHFARSFYNHPPLIGYYLQLISVTYHFGLTLQFDIRAVSSVADVVTALLVFEISRRRGSLRRATILGVIVAASPILFVISGFHGNTDPVFVMFTFLSAHLLADRQRPGLAGVAMALALGVKIVPVVAVPALLVYALILGRPTVLRYLAGLVGVSVIYWVPALALQGHAVVHDVIGYQGTDAREWGISLLGAWAHQPAWARFLEGSGDLLIVAVCALVPAWLVWRRPSVAIPAVALSLTAFLALTPTYGTQYTAWAAAATCLLSLWGGLSFNLAGGALMVYVYNDWNGGLPWDHAHVVRFNHTEQIFGLVVWILLLIVVGDGARRLLRATDDLSPTVFVGAP